MHRRIVADEKTGAAPDSFTLPANTPDATARLAARLAARASPGDILGLSGALGSGKTTLARAFIRARLERAGEEVPSPTFTLVQLYDHAAGAIWHFDLYRLKAPEEAYELGIEDAFAGGIALIEWPERLGAIMPADWLEVHLAPGAGAQARVVTITAHGARARTLGRSLGPGA